MTGYELRFAAGKKRRSVEKKLARDILGSRRQLGKRLVVLIQKLVIETVVQDLAHAFLDLADVHQHPGLWIDRARKDKVSDVVSAGAITRGRLRTERGEIFGVAPFLDEQPTRRGEFEPLADRQEHAGVRRGGRETPSASWRPP